MIALHPVDVLLVEITQRTRGRSCRLATHGVGRSSCELLLNTAEGAKPDLENLLVW